MSSMDLMNNFFGRGTQLNLLKKRVIDLKEGYRQNIAFLGNQYVGKSAMLHRFIAELDDQSVTVIYLDLENKDFSYFFTKFTSSLLYNFSKNRKLPLHNDLSLLIESMKEIIPHTIEVIKKIREDFSKGKNAETFLGLMTLPEIFTNETGSFCVLLLDEFQNLEDFLIPDVFQELGKKIMTQKRCFYVVTSSYEGVARKILSEKLSLLFGNFEVVVIEPFDHQTSQNFIDCNLSHIKIGMQLRNFLTDFTGGYALYLSLISRELLNLSAIYKQDEIYMPLLSKAVENTIFDRWGVISRHFELVVADLCNGKGNRVVASVLMSLANGKHKIDEISKDCSLKKSQATQKVNKLLELGVGFKNGNSYYLRDKLFRYWIKYVYQKRLCDVELAPDKQRKQFKEEFYACVESFKIASRKDVPSRITELLYCFDNEAFDLNGRKYKLPSFRDVSLFKMKNEHGRDFDVLKAATINSIWFIVMKNDHFGEGDINSIVAQTRKIGTRPERCLIISLLDMEENARIKALQERFWIWNEGELNALLTLFDKPYIAG